MARPASRRAPGEPLAAAPVWRAPGRRTAPAGPGGLRPPRIRAAGTGIGGTWVWLFCGECEHSGAGGVRGTRGVAPEAGLSRPEPSRAVPRTMSMEHCSGCRGVPVNNLLARSRPACSASHRMLVSSALELLISARRPTGRPRFLLAFP